MYIFFLSYLGTQGIDISTRMIPLKTFSEIDGGKTCQGNIKVGFVDAEGQGDRDVTYDANLVCPILLTSKCVLLNWMDRSFNLIVLSIPNLYQCPKRQNSKSPRDHA